MLSAFGMEFTARVIPGSGIARKQNVPTLNLSLDDVPAGLGEGIYACHVFFQKTNQPANQKTRFPVVMHYGPRPVHGLPLSCEVHILDALLKDAPASLTVKIVKRIRNVRDFENPKQLTATIQNDIREARAILGT